MTLRRIALLPVALALGACAYYPVPVRGVPPADPWTALPLRRGIAEGPVAPEALAGCWRGDCPEQLAVGVFRATGEEARNLARTLDDPERLARAVRRAPPSPVRRKRPSPEVAADAAPLREGAARGFLLTLARRDGARAPLHGAALGASDGRGLGIVLVIGPDRAAVEDAVRRVARSHLGA